jgi:hypothetical protein
MVYVGMTLLNYLSIDKVDKLMLVMSKLMYGDLSKYGLVRPKEGPFAMKFSGGRTPTVDVGCIKRIKKGKVKVYILLFFFFSGLLETLTLTLFYPESSNFKFIYRDFYCV